MNRIQLARLTAAQRTIDRFASRAEAQTAPSASRHLSDRGKRGPFQWGVLKGIFALALATVWLSGCATNSYRKGDQAATSLQTAAAEVQSESHSLDVTMAALKDLVNEPGPDLKKPLKRFSRALDQLEASAARTQNTGNRMAERNAAFFQAWDQQLAIIDFEHIRNLSEARRTEVTNRFEAVHRRYQESQDVMQPLISYLKDIRKALSTDLTQDGLTTLKDIVRNAEDNSAKVQTALAALTTSLSDSSARMSSVALQSAAGPRNMGGAQ